MAVATRQLGVLLIGLLAWTVECHLRGLSGNSAARRERERYKAELCAPQNQEACGDGQGVLVCEYTHDAFATRCVKKNSFAKHLTLNARNYCGACRKSFQNLDELQSALHKYSQNATQYTTVARIYGWPIGFWHVENVLDMNHLFRGQHTFNEDIGGWDVSRVSNMQGMFLDAYEFDQDLSEWNTSRVRDMSLMFDRAYAFEGHGLDHWDTSRVTSFQRMFRIAKNFQIDISAWNTSQATDLSLMFYRAERFNQPVGDWDVSRVKDLSYVFAFCHHFNQSVAHWKTSSATTTRGMFQNADAFVEDLSEWDMSKVTDTSFMFSNALAFDKAIDGKALWEAWDTTKVEFQDQMFGVIEPLFNQTNVHVLTDLRHTHTDY